MITIDGVELVGPFTHVVWYFATPRAVKDVTKPGDAHVSRELTDHQALILTLHAWNATGEFARWTLPEPEPS